MVERLTPDHCSLFIKDVTISFFKVKYFIHSSITYLQITNVEVHNIQLSTVRYFQRNIHIDRGRRDIFAFQLIESKCWKINPNTTTEQHYLLGENLYKLLTENRVHKLQSMKNWFGNTYFLINTLWCVLL